jgi:hypothetical protein
MTMKNKHMVIDGALSGDSNVVKKKAHNISKYRTLQQKYNACGK